MKIVKKILLFLLIIFVVIQLIRPARNISATSELEIRAALQLPGDVESILKRSCYDCHSNNTNYPWYMNVQPFAWFMANHIEDGNKELNFNSLSNMTSRRQRTKYRAIEAAVEEGYMPLPSYTLIHTNAKLTPHEKAIVINWAETKEDIAD